jgi:CelD/BcsL family acetyltransferase involved in cellulose biosynthesis
LRLGVLTRVADGAPVAAQYWILDQGGAHATVPKLFHLESERAASPGTVLTAMMVHHLIADEGVRTLDFGRGDDAYKAHWVSDRVQKIGLVLADPRHPAGLAALARQAASALVHRLRRLTSPPADTNRVFTARVLEPFLVSTPTPDPSHP